MNPIEKAPVDEADRKLAVLEKARNVLIDAGAGTGKTTLIVSRFVELLAPRDGSKGIPLERMAAVTFTRKAAGELRLRIREGLLKALAEPGLSDARQRLLRTALSGIDSAWIGTIHSVAGQLLRLEPLAVGLSPSFGTVEDAEELVREAWHDVLHAAEAGVLPRLVEGPVPEDRALEAQQTLLDALEIGVRAESLHLEFIDWNGLDALFGAFILNRDIEPPVHEPVIKADLKAFKKLVDELGEFVAGIGNDSYPQQWLRRVAATLADLREEKDPLVLYKAIWTLVAGEPRKVGMGKHFVEDEAGWLAWRAWNGDKTQNPVRDGALRDELVGLFSRWLGSRLMRTFPVAVAAYERVKTRHRVVDQVDLLLKLRNLLRDRPDVRARFQGLFDHLFVDEFQDTDPLQAEVLLYLCEDGATAKRWDKVKLADGHLTLVGDPKQSIYRFRRADVEMYDAVRQKVAEGSHVTVKLRANFRSVSNLITGFNAMYEQVLGAPPRKDQQFDAKQGLVFHAPLAAGLEEPGTTPVWVMPLEAEDTKVDAVREGEAEAWARCLVWLVEHEKPEVRDPVSRKLRPVQYGDVAMLSHATTNTELLLSALDKFGVPWTARGGSLFMRDPLHQQFLLGLRALANRDDGVAQMALMRPPFFSVDLAEVALGRMKAPPDAVKEKLGPVTELVERLRRERFERGPGDTARDLLELSGFARHVALGPNGEQRLERLRELCLIVERTAAEEGLDFDGVTAKLRAAVDEPTQFDAPHPVGAQAVQVLTIYQAKGLEFPVVALWDSCAPWTPTQQVPAWMVSRDGKQWAIKLKDFHCEVPEDAKLVEKEKNYAAAERRRVVYVAGTRARDLLLIPQSGKAKPDRHIADKLVVACPPEIMRKLASLNFTKAHPPWARVAKPFKRSEPKVLKGQVASFDDAWVKAVAVSGRKVLVPSGVSTEAHRVIEARSADDDVAEPPFKVRESRHGKTFGLTVHRAIGLVLTGAANSVDDAVARAAREHGLQELLRSAAVDDASRTLTTLAQLGVVAKAAAGSFVLEYPVGAARGEVLLGGYIDLLVAKDGALMVIDFKTDAAPKGEVKESHPAYVEQVATYAALLEEAGLAPKGTVKRGLLFTETGALSWV